MPGPPTVSGGIGDLGSCLMSADPVSRRVKELETDGGAGRGGTEGRTEGTGAGTGADLPLTEL